MATVLRITEGACHCTGFQNRVGDMCSDASNAVGIWALTVNMLLGGLCVI